MGNFARGYDNLKQIGKKPQKSGHAHNRQEKAPFSSNEASLVRMSGLEPMTPCMSSRYSNQLSYTLTTIFIIAHLFRFVNPFSGFFSKKSKKFLG